MGVMINCPSYQCAVTSEWKIAFILKKLATLVKMPQLGCKKHGRTLSEIYNGKIHKLTFFKQLVFVILHDWEGEGFLANKEFRVLRVCDVHEAYFSNFVLH